MSSRPEAVQADFKIYCDESCHLPHDGSNTMSFGALCCAADAVPRILNQIKQLRFKHGYHQEIKWTKLVAKQIDFYRDLIDLFAETDALRFKALIVSDKKLLDHDVYNGGSHNTFYYKTAYYALRDFLVPNKVFRLYLDYMDTQGSTRAKTLVDVLKSHAACPIYAHIIRSHESQLIQLCDLLVGAVTYANRTDIPRSSHVKNEVIKHLQQRLRRNLAYGSPPWETKFNLFKFKPREQM